MAAPQAPRRNSGLPTVPVALVRERNKGREQQLKKERKKKLKAAASERLANRIVIGYLIQIQAVNASSVSRKRSAWKRSGPHISYAACKLAQTAGRKGEVKILHKLASSSWMQRTPAGLPSGIPGIGDEIDGAIQQAPQPRRQVTLEHVREVIDSFKLQTGLDFTGFHDRLLAAPAKAAVKLRIEHLLPASKTKCALFARDYLAIIC